MPLDFPGAALRERARSAPSTVGFVMGDAVLRFGDLLRDAEQLAGGLVAAGVRRGDRVAFVLPAGLDFVRAFYAVQLAGAVPCAMNPSLPPAAQAQRLAALRPALVLGDGAPGNAAGAGIASATLAELPATGPLPHLPVARGRELSHLQLTSGTSGQPRAAMITHQACRAYLQSLRTTWNVGADDVMVAWVPPWHDLGLLFAVLGPVVLGFRCHLVTPSVRTIPLWLETLSRANATITGAPDFAYRLACRLVDPDGLDLRHLRCATNGGEVVRLSTVREFEARFDVRGALMPGYGLAEVTLGATTLRPGRQVRTDEHGHVSCGPPMDGVELTIRDDDGRVLPRGETGEIALRTRSLFSGYFDAEQETRQVLRGGWLFTGDIGRLDAAGELYVLGRRRSLIKRSGAVVAPREVEEPAERLAAVRLCAAVGLRQAGDATAEGEQVLLAAEIDFQDGAAAAELAQSISAAVQEALGFVPAEVVLLAPRSIPRTENGKVRHDALRHAFATGDIARSGRVLFGRADGWRI